MEEKDFIKELFQEKLAQHQSPVSPDLWASVSSSIASGSTVIGSGISIFAKSIIAALSAAFVIGTVWFLSQKEAPSDKNSGQKSNQLKDRNELPEKITPVTSLPELKDSTSPATTSANSVVNSLTDSPTFSASIELNQPQKEQVEATTSLETANAIISLPQTETTKLKKPIDTQLEQPILSTEEAKIILPNIFTPNGDGSNDDFKIDLSAFEFNDFSLVILDPFNKVVYQSNATNFVWDGKRPDGDACEAGTYIYYLTGKTTSGATISKYATLRIQY